MMMKTIGAVLLAAGAAGLVALCATTGSVMYAQTPGTERSHVGEVVVGQPNGAQIAQAQPPAGQKTGVTALSEKDDNQTISVKAGDKIEIKLKSNPTTGYGWKVASVSGNSVKQDGAISYVTDPLPPNSPPLVGRGGYSVVKFDAVSAGKVTITMEYCRPWEKNKPAARTFTITLDVK